MADHKAQTFAVGQKVEIWSASQNAWIPGEILQAWVADDTHTVETCATFSVKAGTLFVEYAGRKKYILPQEVSSSVRQAQTSFAVGQKVEIWSASQNAWILGDIDQAWSADATHTDDNGRSFLVKAGTLFVKYADSSKYIPPQQVSSSVRQAKAVPLQGSICRHVKADASAQLDQLGSAKVTAKSDAVEVDSSLGAEVSEASGSASVDSTPTENLLEKVSRIREQLGLSSTATIANTISEACTVLGINVPEGSTLPQRADMCLQELKESDDVPVFVEDEDSTTQPSLPSPTSGKGDFSLKLLSALIKTGNLALKHVEGQDVIAMLGATGTGKSTLMQFIFSGRPLKKFKHLKRDTYVYVAENPIEGFDISHRNMSQTLGVKHYVPPGTNGPVYLDTAGYADTRGPEVDIATSVSFRKVARKCRSLRFVVLLSAASLIIHRGVVIGDLLRMVGTFVKDFYQHRYAFTFLFAHTGALANLQCHGIKAIKVKLKNLLAGIRDDGGFSEKHKMILEWMCECLEKDLPFVDVFHPELSKASELKQLLETLTEREEGHFTAIGLKPGLTAEKVVTCGLTAQMESWLYNQLGNAMKQIQTAFENKSNGTDTITAVFQQLHFLRENFDSKIVLTKVEEADTIFKKSHEKILDKVWTQTYEGTTIGFGDSTAFDKTKAEHVLESIDMLDQLTKIESAIQEQPPKGSNVRPYLLEQVGCLVQRLTDLNSGNLKSGKDLIPSLAVLRLLRTWEEASQSMIGTEKGKKFSDLVELCGKGTEQVDVFVQSMVRKAGELLVESSITDAIHILGLLAYLNEQISDVRALGVEAYGLEQQFETLSGHVDNKVQRALKSTTQTLSKIDVSEDACTPDFVPPHDANIRDAVDAFRSCASEFEAAVDAVSGADLSIELKNSINHAQNEFASTVQTSFGHHISTVKALTEQLSSAGGREDIARLAPVLKFVMHRLREILDALTPNQRSKIGMPLYARARNLISYMLIQQSGHPDVLGKQLLECGLINPPEHLRIMSILIECIWLDDEFFLPGKDDLCVSDRIGQMKSHYLAYHTSVKDKLGVQMEVLKNSGLTDQDARPSMQILFLEASRLADFSFVDPVYAESSEFVESALIEWTKQREGILRDFVVNSSAIDLERLGEMPAQEIHGTFFTLEWLNESIRGAKCEHLVPSQMRDFEHGLEQALALRSTMIRSHVKDEALGDAGRTACVFKALSSWKDLQLLLQRLPKQEELCRAVQEQVSGQAEKIRGVLQESEGAAAVEIATEDLKKLKLLEVLDPYIWNQAGKDIQLLSQLIDSRRNDLDAAFREQVANFNFKGIDRHVQELIESNVPAAKTKLDILLRCIGHSVCAKIALANKELVAGGSAGKLIEELRRADRDVGDSLKFYSNIDIKSEIKDMEDRVTTQLTKLLDEGDTALEPITNTWWPRKSTSTLSVKEFLSVAKSFYASDRYVQAMWETNLLSPKITKRHQKQKDKALIQLQKTNETIDPFIQSLLGNSSIDPSGLIELLNDLKRLGFDAEPPSEQLAQIYQSMIKTLQSKILDTHREAQAKLKDGVHSVAIQAYRNLKECMLKGLEVHLPRLGVDFSSELKNAETLAERVEENVREDLKTREGIQHQIQQMDNLKRQSSLHGSWFYKDHYHKAYTSQVELVIREVKKMRQDAQEAMKRQDYKEVAANYVHIKRVCPSCIPHFRGMDAVLQSMQELLDKEFGTLSCEMLGTLQRGSHQDIQSLEKLFMQYRKWCHSMLAATDKNQFAFNEDPYVKAIEKSCVVLEDSYNKFDVKKIKETIPILRSWARLLHGILALCFEEGEIALPLLQELQQRKCFSVLGQQFSEVGKSYALLEIDPGSPDADVSRAYRNKARECQPDKQHGPSDDSMARRMKAASDRLQALSKQNWYNEELKIFFNAKLSGWPDEILHSVEDSLVPLRESKLKLSVTAIENLHLVYDLCTPTIAYESYRNDARKLIVQRKQDLRVHAEKHWNERDSDAQALSKLSTTLDELDFLSSFSAYADDGSSDIFEIIRTKVVNELESTGATAQSLLKDREDESIKHMLEFASQLIMLAQIMDDLPRFKELAQWKIHNLLESVTFKSWGMTYLFQLGVMLESGQTGRFHQGSSGNEVRPEDDRLGKLVVYEFRHFKDILTMVFNDQTAARKNIETVVKDVTAKQVSTHKDVEVHRAELLKGFAEYEKEFDKQFHSWRGGQLTLEALALIIKDQATRLRPCSIQKWSARIKQEIPSMLGRIFLYFTVLKSGESYKNLIQAEEGSGGRFEKDSILLKPHCIQVVAILRALGYDSPCESLESHLLHIRTGEGKSLILGACSVLLGLLGFPVRCVCYSDYLSQRDFNLFKDLFAAFGVSDYIKYSKITKYKEDVVASKGDIRALTLDLFAGRDLGKGVNATQNAEDDTHSTSEIARRSDDQTIIPLGESSARVQRGPDNSNDDEILLVDEVDVFFGAEFYGQTYNVVALFESNEVVALLESIWKKRGNAKSGNFRVEILHSAEYKALVNRFPDWKAVLELEVKAMCADVQKFEVPRYTYDPKKDRVGYPIMDGISYDVVFGYKTAFAYLNESTSKSALNKTLRLRLSCGRFSYANIRPACILGVSGTLEALGGYEWEVMAKYGLETYTLLPSVYGQGNFKFLNQTNAISVAHSLDDYHRNITQMVKTMVHKEAGRAVIVFFESRDKLDLYYNSPHYAGITTSKALLTEDLDNNTKGHVIKKAATSGHATFTTAIFGRGTDFACHDGKMLEKGGVHVIQTFVAADSSEEKQIQGRTARQGKDGTYALILLKDDLEGMNVNVSAVDEGDAKAGYKELQRAMQERCEKRAQVRDMNLDTAKKCDDLTHAYFDALIKSNTSLAKEKLVELYTSNSVKNASAGHRVHFSGVLIADFFGKNKHSEAFQEDEHGEYVGVGEYPNNQEAFPNAIRCSFDAVAVDAGTRVIIYSQPNFKGEVLWDVVGPAVIVNSIWMNRPDLADPIMRKWKEPLQSIFPEEVREWSNTDMHQWDSGSLIIEGGAAIPQALKDGVPEYSVLPNETY